MEKNVEKILSQSEKNFKKFVEDNIGIEDIYDRMNFFKTQFSYLSLSDIK